MSFFNGQDFTIILETNNASLGSATTKQILYAKPDGTKGAWDASVSGTTLIYNTQEGDIDKTGMWKFQAYIVVGGLEGFGDIVTKHLKQTLL